MTQPLIILVILTAPIAVGPPESSEWEQRTAEDRIRGLATYYAPGLMEKVAANRGLHLDGFHSGVALNRKGDLGRVVWLRWPDEDGNPKVTGPHLVVDCAQERHYPIREEQGRVVEVSAELAGELGFYGLGPIPVRAFFAPAPGERWPRKKPR